ncbi:hypothetical protein BC827DRAFT_1151831 [Russula dissimulans]|nr:hypothetical protein BC827DRAFT_1151831 [Russula dissimulans]
MSLPPASNDTGIIQPHYSLPVQPPLLAHQPELFGYDWSQRNSWDTHFNNLRHTGSFDPSAYIHTSASNVPQAPQAPAQNFAHSHLPFLNDQPLLGPIPPTAPPAMLDGFGQHLSTDQTFQPWPTCTCVPCPAYSTFWPAPFDDERSTFASRDATAPSRSSSRQSPASSLHSRRSIQSVPAQFPGVANAGSGIWGVRAASRGSVRPSSRPGRAPSVRSAQGRRARSRPLVRVEDRIEWVRHDVMKMTLFFNLSPHAEAEVHEPWG